MDKYLKDMLKRLNTKKENLLKRSDESEDVAEVKAISKELDEVNAEIKEAEAKLAEVEAEEKEEANKESEEARKAFNPMNVLSTTKREEVKNEIATATMEYRTAFMEYVQKGTKSPILNTRSGDTQGTASNLGILIPQTIIQEIMTGVEKVYGQLYSRVRKTNIPGGVKYPIGSFSATFNRITETTKSDRQNAGGYTGEISFTYNIGEIRLARTLLQAVLTVDAFEREFAKVVVEAYVKAMDKEIMVGVSSNHECVGILTEANNAAQSTSRFYNLSDHIIGFTEAEMADWESWQKKLFAKIPLSMRSLNPEFVMTANTYEANIKTLKDNNNRPVYNETFNPVDGAEIARFKGKNVVFVEDDILGNFDDISVAAESTDSPYFGMYWVPEEGYAINTNLEFTVREYFDEEKNEYVKKALVINDGKILDPKYIYLLKKVAPVEG